MKKNSLWIILTFACIAIVALYFILLPEKYAVTPAIKGDITGVVKESATICGQESRKYYALVSAPIESFDLKEGDRVEEGDILLQYDLSDLEYARCEATINREQSEAACAGAIQKSDENLKRYEEAKEQDLLYGVLYATVREEEQALLEQQHAEDVNRQCAVDGINKKIAQKNEEILDKSQELDKTLDKVEKYRDMEEEVPKRVKKKKKDLTNDLNDLNDELLDLQTEAAGVYHTMLSPEANEKINDDINNMEDIKRQWEQAIERKQNYEASFMNEEEKESLEKQAEAAKESEAWAIRELEKGTGGVKAEFDGVVTSCNVKKDAFVQEGTELFTIESTGEVKAKVEVSRFDIGSIECGQEALVQVADGSYKGYVTYISSRAVTDDSDKSRIEVEVTVDEPDSHLILGVDADVTIYTQRSYDAVLIPADAYYTDDDGSYCYLLAGGKIEKRYFEPGIVNDEYVECKAGIESGEQLITDAVTDSMTGKRAAALEVH
ncbi:MAG: efflux RND transporter periplasmic adaptor subunit [Lachnospiraceae bacterium]|nr:efflux RND transporter periplasmic adaptor subunit [Lachnospiraceae bacterium]